ncbi:MAG: Gfo/Idh/MocA family oxidoreductase [Planctomycetes bacterium]|nr:Gfo/Idh/MocA family oxidoreductase [Planctomycetota bacterium]
MLHVAVIGAGNIAQKHLAVLRDLPDIHLALADRDARMLQETGERFGVERRHDSIRPLLEDDRPDAVFVLVSVLAVSEVASAFLRAGVPTFLEKPPGLHTRQTRDLARLARERKTLAMVGVNRRFYSAILRGRGMLLEAGPVRSVTVEAHEDLDRIRKGTKFPEEVLRRWGAANGIHALDLLRYFGGEVARVSAVQRTFEGPMADSCAAILEYENGALGRAAMDWSAPGGHRFEVRGPGVTLTSNPGFDCITFERRGHDPIALEADEDDRKYKAGFLKQDRTFLECVRTGLPLPFPACDLEDAARTMALIDMISGAD